MTAIEFIDKMKPQLTGMNLKDDNSVLLSFLNMCKDELARDVMLWVDGEEVTLSQDTFEYTLSTMPVQILDVYDDNYDVITRNSYSAYDKGYFQISPQVIKLTYNPQTDSTLYVNYYKTPPDYELSDNIDIPPMLHKAVRHFIIHECLTQYKGEKEIANASNHLNIYSSFIEKYKEQTDSIGVETLVNVDLIKQKGLV